MTLLMLVLKCLPMVHWRSRSGGALLLGHAVLVVAVAVVAVAAVVGTSLRFGMNGAPAPSSRGIVSAHCKFSV